MRKIKKKKLVNEFENYANDFLKENYNMSLKIPIEINSRLSRALGRFISYRDVVNGYRFSKSIELSKKFIEHNDMDAVLSTLRHELIHYALFEIGLPHEDGTFEFERELRNHNAHSTGTQRASLKKHVYECGCGKEFRRLRKDGHNYICNICRKELKFKKTEMPKKVIEII